MPIIDIQWVAPRTEILPCTTQLLVDALGAAFGAAPGHVWLRMQRLDADDYAENHAPVDPDSYPVFVTVLHAHPPQGEALDREMQALGATVAGCMQRPVERVHLQYAPPAAGRQSFGGQWVR